MTQITKEAIEAGIKAADNFYLNEATDSDTAFSQAVEAGIRAALSTLPIAGEGKVKALEWHESLTDDGREQWHSNDRESITVMGNSFSDHERYWLFHAKKGFPSLHDAKAAAQADYETRVLSALTSSPGKDGGQEVEAVPDRGETCPHCKGEGCQPGDPEGAPLEACDYCNGSGKKISTQPASTALVERLANALRKAENVLEVYADPTGYTDGYGDQVPADAVQHEGLLAQEALDIVRSALSASLSTSREGESE